MELSPRLLEELNAKLKWNRYIPHYPSDRQMAALLCSDWRELMYGGAAGGGKSDYLLMAALQYVDVPGYAALLIMRTTSDLKLPEALLSRAEEWLGGTDARWKEQDKQWVFPSGARLNFGYLEHEVDKYRYKTSAFQFIGFDELTQFTESQYTYMFSRNRKPKGSPIPLRMRSGTNPDGPGYDWVKMRFITEGRERGRLFIPALLNDNQYIDKESYIENLMELDPITRKRLLEGDWNVRPGGKKFKREWFEIVSAYPAGMKFVRYWDMAGTEPKPGKDPDYMAGVKVGLTSQGIYYVCDVKRARLSPQAGEALILQTAHLDREQHGNNISIYMEQEPGDSGKRVIDHFTRTVLRGFAFYGHRSTGAKELRANPVSSQAEAQNVKLVEGAWNREFLDELVAFPTPGVHDDQVDALSGACEVIERPPLVYHNIPASQKGKRKSIFEMEREYQHNGGGDR